MLARIWRKGNILLLVGMQTSTVNVGGEKRFLRKLNIDLPYDPVVVHLCIYLKESESYYRDTGSTLSLVILFTITRK